MRTPDQVIQPAAEQFLAVVADHPGDIRTGHSQLVDLAAVLAGEQAPSISRRATERRGHHRQPPQMPLAEAAARAMSYTSAVTGSAADAALTEFRRRVLNWTPPGNVPLPSSSAPPPSARSRWEP